MLPDLHQTGFALLFLTAPLAACQQEQLNNSTTVPEQTAIQERPQVPQLNNIETTTHILNVGPDLLECDGPFPQHCLVVDGQLFYDRIEGFTHQADISFVLEVERSARFPGFETPQDVSPYHYRLIRVISSSRE